MEKKVYKKSTTKILTTRYKPMEYQFILNQAHKYKVTVSDYIRWCTVMFSPDQVLDDYIKRRNKNIQR